MTCSRCGTPITFGQVHRCSHGQPYALEEPKPHEFEGFRIGTERSHCNARGTDEYGGFLHAVKGEDWQIPATERSAMIAAAPEMLKVIASLRTCPVGGSGQLLAPQTIWDRLEDVYRLAHGMEPLA